MPTCWQHLTSAYCSPVPAAQPLPLLWVNRQRGGFAGRQVEKRSMVVDRSVPEQPAQQGQRLGGKRLVHKRLLPERTEGAGKLFPEPCRARRVEAHFISNGVGEVAAEECFLPMGKALQGELLWRAHGPMAHFAVEVNVPEGSMKECGAALRPPAFGERAEGELPAARDLEDQRRRRELLAGDRRQLRILVEEQGPGGRRNPPGGDEFIPRQDVVRQDLKDGVPAQPLDRKSVV